MLISLYAMMIAVCFRNLCNKDICFKNIYIVYYSSLKLIFECFHSESSPTCAMKNICLKGGRCNVMAICCCIAMTLTLV